jgi:membrane carboxypeptidase/penicillin-binding protein
MRKITNLMMLGVLLVLATAAPSFAQPRKATTKKTAKVTKAKASRSASKYRVSGKKVRSVRNRKRHRYYERFTGNSFATNQSEGDRIDGEDQTVRQAALDALGNMNGSIVVVDPTTGRILTMVNQKVALGSGAIPCSTIKPFVGLAALSEGIEDKDTEVALGPRMHNNMT